MTTKVSKVNSSHFEKYIFLENEFSFSYNDINYGVVLSPQFREIAYDCLNDSEIKLNDIRRLIISSKEVVKLKEAFDNYDFVVTTLYNRKDYNDLISSCFCSINYTKINLLDLPYIKSFNLKHILIGIKKCLLKSSKISFKKRLYLTSYTIYYLNIYSSIEKCFKNFSFENKSYIAFNSSYDIETLLTQYFNKKTKNTFHLSHGVSYIIYGNFIPIDILNGRNIQAKNVLSWGESSKSYLEPLFVAQNKNCKIIVAGNPQYPYKEINIKTTFKKGIVFLGRSIYDDSNFKLLILLSEIYKTFKIYFDIKPHPSSDIELYKNIVKEMPFSFLTRELTPINILRSGEYDFAVAYNTTTYFEAMYYDLLCFRYSLNENELYEGLDDKFSTLDEFEMKINYFKETNFSTINKIVHKVLVNNLGMGINEYNNLV